MCRHARARLWDMQFFTSYLIVLLLLDNIYVSYQILLHKYSTRIVRTKYGPLRGIIVHGHQTVEAFLGVPYATPPVGSLRYMPPVTPSMWRATRLADRMSAVCPQRVPNISNKTEALLEFPRGRLHYMEKLLPLLANQSEDCLYMNVYVPRSDNTPEDNSRLPCILFVHGESYEWNSGNPYDGSMLASFGHVIVATINFRLGVLGFLKTGAKGSNQGNFGLMDLIAGLHWLRENLPAFGGDPERITLMGHGTGAALANFIAVSPVAKELFHRVILLSGSGLSPWALQKEPLLVKRRVAEQTSCHGDLEEEDLAPCLRLKPLHDLLNVEVEPPRFLPGFAPFIDGTVLLHSLRKPQSPLAATSSTLGSFGYDMSGFVQKNLLFSVTSVESYLDLSAQDLEYGFNETKKDRILRTYVRNAYLYHLNEIYSTLKNEYTDWERPVQNMLSVRDATLDVLSDGHTVSPLIRVGYLHATGGGKTFFMNFQHQSSQRDFPQSSGAVHGEDIAYVFGLPLVNGEPFFPHNYSHTDSSISKRLMHYIANFARNGDPNDVPNNRNAPNKLPETRYQYSYQQSDAPHNEASVGENDLGSLESTESAAQSTNLEEEQVVRMGSDNVREEDDDEMIFWDTYDTINQLYLSCDSKFEMKSHYRGHKMSLWLNLIPQLHRPGDGDMSMRHHHFQEEGAQFYDGSVRPQSMQRPSPMQTNQHLDIKSSTDSSKPTPTSTQSTIKVASTECPPNNTALNANGSNYTNDNLLRKLATTHYQSYTTALTVTIGVGCFLLLLNILIFAGIYHQRDKSRTRARDKRKIKEEQQSIHEIGSCCSTSSSEMYPSKINSYDTPSHHRHHHHHHHATFNVSAFDAANQKAATFSQLQSPHYEHKKIPIDNQMMELQELKSSPTSVGKRQMELQRHQQKHATMQNATQQTSPPSYVHDDTTQLVDIACGAGSSEIPEPPPPPKSQAPGGILRTQSGTSMGAFSQATATPSASKKRVQIQEISV